MRRLAALGGLLAVLALPAIASGHALLQTADPAPGSTLGAAPTSVTITFGETPDPRLSSIKVLDQGGANHATGAAQPLPGDSASLRTAVGSLGDGIYTVSWRTVSAVDGHVAAGSYAFGVGVTPPPTTAAASAAAASGSPAAILARFLLYAGAIVLLGTGYVGFFVGRAAPTLRIDILRRLAAGAWLVAGVGSVLVVAVTWEEAGGDVAALLGSSVGTIAIARLLAAVLAAIPVALLVRGGPAPGRRWLGLAAVGAVLVMTVDVASGHAASAASGPIGLVATWVHVVTAGLWIGGLLALLVAVRGAASADKAATVRRFSTWAAPWIGLVALTGVIRAIQEVGSIDGLFGLPYGQLVIGKSVLLLVLAGLGATNRWWSVPAADRTLGRLRRVGTTELGIATVVVALAAALVNGVPPVSLGASAASGPRPIVVSGSDQGTSLRLRLAISPGSVGTNTFDAAVTDFDTGKPIPATGVSLRFKLLSRSGVGDSTLALAAASAGQAGAFTGSGANLSVDGIWKITATVSETGTAAEVDLVTATSIPDELVDVLPASGAPTLYTIHLPDGTTAQVYLDPGKAGPGELHCTFFDAQGTERPITQATMAVATGAGQVLTARLLEPGHFVADLDTQAGSLPVDVVGIDAAGTQVHVHATIEVTP